METDTQQTEERERDLEDDYIDLLDDAYGPEEGVVYSRKVWLTRCSTDRPLYSLFVDGEIEFTIDSSELTATHQVEELLEMADSGDIDEFTGDSAPTRGWH